MANFDQPSSSASGDHQPLVPASHYSHEGGNLQAVPVNQGYGDGNFARTPTVVNGGIDASWFFNSLRRRWLLATFMGLLLAAGAGFALFWLFPESDTAAANFLVKASPEVLVYEIDSNKQRGEYEIFRETQIALLKSPPVLNVALQNPQMQQVATLRKEKDPLTWLYKNLDIRYMGDSELLQVSMTLDEQPDNLKVMVDAVCKAYEQEVLDADRLEQQKIRDALELNLSKMREDIREGWKKYEQLAKDLGVADGQFDPAVRMLYDELDMKMKEKADLEKKLRDLQLQYATYISQSDNPGMKEMMINGEVAADENLQIMQQELLGLQVQLRDAQSRSKGRPTREIRRIEEQMATKQQQINASTTQLRDQIRSRQATQPDYQRGMVTEQFQQQMQFLALRLQQLNEGRDITKPDGEVIRDRSVDEIKDELKSKANDSTELVILENGLRQKEEVADDLAHRIDERKIELAAKPRVVWTQHAYIIPGINRMQRYAIAGLGSIATFLLACVGIAYLEFLSRRLNGPNQLDEGLGIRVVGTLPALNAKRMMNPKHPLVAQLTESIDSVRTALMHDSTSKPRQVVLVTSPAAMEGRTTVASQLAASLARAGRRTLLIDGDLRRPALHMLFDVPLEDGLCEVLRAETEVTDVVRPTHAEGLWLMTAGYCDADAVHAMATDQIQPIFEKLRSEYDFVIIDGAPVLGLSDSLMMGQHSDGALLSVLRDHTSVPSIYKSAELLRDVGVRLIGSVVNGVSAKADRRVTHLQAASPKAARKQLESQSKEQEVAVGAQSDGDLDELDDFDFGDMSNDK